MDFAHEKTELSFYIAMGKDDTKQLIDLSLYAIEGAELLNARYDGTQLRVEGQLKTKFPVAMLFQAVQFGLSETQALQQIYGKSLFLPPQKRSTEEHYSFISQCNQNIIQVKKTEKTSKAKKIIDITAHQMTITLTQVPNE